MSDAEWQVLGAEAIEVMAQIRLVPGRPMDHPVRSMLDAVRYLVRNGIEWRAMPVDFPPWEAVYAFHDRWSRRDLPQRLCHRLRERLRRHGGRNSQPTAAIVDSQSVKSAEWAHTLEVGYDGGNYADPGIMPRVMPKTLVKGGEIAGLVGIIPSHSIKANQRSRIL